MTLKLWAVVVSSLALAPATVGLGESEAPDRRRAAAEASALADSVVGKSSAADRESLALTVYNQNFGLVREVRNVRLPRGQVALEFADVASSLQTETVRVEPLGRSGRDFRVLEQNYRYDLLNPQKLLEKYVGRTVTVYRWNQELDREEALEAEVLSTNGGTILRIGDEITFNSPGRIVFPEIPEDLMAQPTLVWLVDNPSPEVKLDVSYLTGGLNWKSDYVMVLNEDDDAADLTGWVTLTNNSGASYENAALKLVAGDVQRVSGRREDYPMSMDELRNVAAEASAAGFTEQSFFEYHLYSLGRPTTVRNNEQKQVTLLEANNFGVQKRMFYYGAPHYYRGQYGSIESNQKVGVFLEFQNSEANRMGMPLPAGVVRVYKDDGTGAQQFIGEDRIDHTPRDEQVRVRMGEAFDVVGSRTQTEFEFLGSCTSRSTWEVEVRNHKDEPAEVTLVEPAGGEWSIVRSDHEYTKVDQRTFHFDVELPARESVKVTYTIRVRWC